MISLIKKFLFSLFLFLIFAFGVFSVFHKNIAASIVSSWRAHQDSVSWEIESSKSFSYTCTTYPKITFFMYHYIRDHDPKDNASTKDLSVPPALFEEQMKKVKSLVDSWDVVIMTDSEFKKAKISKCFPEKPVWIFISDDGWIDTYDSLVPIATKYHIPFFLGIITGDVDKKWFVTTEDVRSISQNPLMTIASHSVSHNDESHLSEKDTFHEMCDSKTILEKMIGKPVDTFIYPSGRINTEFAPSMEKKCGYEMSFSTEFGKKFDPSAPDFYRINRTRIHGNTDPSFFDHFLKNESKVLWK